MFHHLFLFQPGSWFGEGKIQLNMVEEDLDFTMIWNVLNKDSAGKVQCVQEIQVEGLSDVMKNEFTFYDFKHEFFTVEMNNSNIGRIIGSGIIDSKLISWEFRENDMRFEGMESYTLQEDGSYYFLSEYVTQEQLRTHIEGLLWKRNQSKNQMDSQTNQGETTE